MDKDFSNIISCYKASNRDEALSIIENIAKLYSPKQILRSAKKFFNSIADNKLELTLYKDLCSVINDVSLNLHFADRLIQSRENSQALAAYEKVIKLKPDNIRAIKSYALALAYSGQIEKACEEFEKALELDPENQGVLNSYGKACATAGKKKMAHKIFECVLTINPNNLRALGHYSKLLMDSKKFKSAIGFLEHALGIDPFNRINLNNYGKALAESGNNEKACEVFERVLPLEPNDLITLVNYGKALAASGQIKKACEIFERALALKPDDTITLINYGQVLVNSDQKEKACEIFARVHSLDPNNQLALTNYGKTLADTDQLEKACEVYERALLCTPKKIQGILHNYGKLLAYNYHPAKASEIFERALSLDPNNLYILRSYGKVLADSSNQEKAIKIFERILALDPDNIITLSMYAKSLVETGQTREACNIAEQLAIMAADNPITQATVGVIFTKCNRATDAISYFQKSLAMSPNNLITLTNYGKTLLLLGMFGEAIEKFELASISSPNDHVLEFMLGIAYQGMGEYDKAIKALEQYEHHGGDPANPRLITVIRLMLGRLHYLRRNESKGNHYFQLAMSGYRDTNAGRLRTAMQMLSVRPDSEEALELLSQVAEDSPWYKQAMQILSLNMDAASFFGLHENAEDEQEYDIELLNSAVYHKIQNEITLLKGIVYELISDFPSSEGVAERILGLIERLISEIKMRRHEQTARIKQIPAGMYKELLKTISNTAHDISDFVNNEMAVLKGEIQLELMDSTTDPPLVKKLGELQRQVDLTQFSLNELKSINESVRLRNSNFILRELLETWLTTTRLGDTSILINFNGEESFCGDERKIRGFIGELIENSMKHNAGKKDLRITISVELLNNLPAEMGQGLFKKYRVAGDKKWLQIVLEDNGKGIPFDKKDWIFLPLKSTYADSSGLGLFIIRRTLKEMKGYIRETGDDGARFEIYIPQGEQNE